MGIEMSDIFGKGSSSLNDEYTSQYKEYINKFDERISAFKSYDWQKTYKLMNENRLLLGTEILAEDIEQNKVWKRIY